MMNGNKSYLISFTALFAKKGYELTMGVDTVFDTQRDTQYHLSAPAYSTYHTLKLDVLKNANKSPYSTSSLFGERLQQAEMATDIEGIEIQPLLANVVSFLIDIQNHMTGQNRLEGETTKRTFSNSSTPLTTTPYPMIRSTSSKSKIPIDARIVNEVCTENISDFVRQSIVSSETQDKEFEWLTNIHFVDKDLIDLNLSDEIDAEFIQFADRSVFEGRARRVDQVEKYTGMIENGGSYLRTSFCQDVFMDRCHKGILEKDAVEDKVLAASYFNDVKPVEHIELNNATIQCVDGTTTYLLQGNNHVDEMELYRIFPLLQSTALEKTVLQIDDLRTKNIPNTFLIQRDTSIFSNTRDYTGIKDNAKLLNYKETSFIVSNERLDKGIAGYAQEIFLDRNGETSLNPGLGRNVISAEVNQYHSYDYEKNAQLLLAINKIESNSQTDSNIMAEQVVNRISESPEILNMCRLLEIMYGSNAAEFIQTGIESLALGYVDKGKTFNTAAITESVISCLNQAKSNEMHEGLYSYGEKGDTSFSHKTQIDDDTYSESVQGRQGIMAHDEYGALSEDEKQIMLSQIRESKLETLDRVNMHFNSSGLHHFVEEGSLEDIEQGAGEKRIDSFMTDTLVSTQIDHQFVADLKQFEMALYYNDASIQITDHEYSTLLNDYIYSSELRTLESSYTFDHELTLDELSLTQAEKQKVMDSTCALDELGERIRSVGAAEIQLTCSEYSMEKESRILFAECSEPTNEEYVQISTSNTSTLRFDNRFIIQESLQGKHITERYGQSLDLEKGLYIVNEEVAETVFDSTNHVTLPIAEEPQDLESASYIQIEQFEIGVIESASYQRDYDAVALPLECSHRNKIADGTISMDQRVNEKIQIYDTRMHHDESAIRYDLQNQGINDNMHYATSSDGTVLGTIDDIGIASNNQLFNGLPSVDEWAVSVVFGDGKLDQEVSEGSASNIQAAVIQGLDRSSGETLLEGLTEHHTMVSHADMNMISETSEYVLSEVGQGMTLTFVNEETQAEVALHNNGAEMDVAMNALRKRRLLSTHIESNENATRMKKRLKTNIEIDEHGVRNKETLKTEIEKDQSAKRPTKVHALMIESSSDATNKTEPTTPKRKIWLILGKIASWSIWNWKKTR